MSELRIKELRKAIGDFELQASFVVRQGERLALVGPSGCGKTSLLRWIAGLDPECQSGELSLDQKSLLGVPSKDREIGLVFQDGALFPTLNACENVAFGLRVRGVPRAERRRQAEAWLTQVGMGDRKDAQIETLSGGERQRVALARALIWKPQLILLDEPFSAVDRALRETLGELLLKLHRDLPVPMILVSHDEADLARVATRRIAVRMEDGGRIRKFADQTP